MIEKKDFIFVLSQIEKQIEKDQNLVRYLISNNYIEGNPVGCFSDILLNTTIKLLSTFFEDDVFTKKIDTWIEWFIFENDFGNKKMSCFIDKIEYNITNSEEMYDFLIKWKYDNENNW